jgi:membrane protein implicated in regulation of membrane protease activity
MIFDDVSPVIWLVAGILLLGLYILYLAVLVVLFPPKGPAP